MRYHRPTGIFGSGHRSVLMHSVSLLCAHRMLRQKLKEPKAKKKEMGDELRTRKTQTPKQQNGLESWEEENELMKREQPPLPV